MRKALLILVLLFGATGCIFEDVEDTAIVVFLVAIASIVFTMAKVIQHFSKEDADEIDQHTKDMFV